MATPKPSDRVRIRARVIGLRLPADLVKELKHIAVDTDRSLREVFIAAASEYAGKYRKRG